MTALPLANLADCIQACAVPIVVTRRRMAPVVDGEAGTPTEETFCPVAHVQRLNGDDLQMLPEGFRTEASIKIYTIDRLTVGDSPEIADPDRVHYPDRVCYRGENYQVMTVDDWKLQGNYYKSIASKVGQ